MKKYKVLLVQPKTPSTFWTLDSAIKAIGAKAVLPPLGLLTVAAMLPENFEAKLVDMNVEELCLREVERSDLVFLSGMCIHRKSFLQVVDLCHKLGKTIVAGGPIVMSALGVTAQAKFDDLESDKIDHFILAEAEVNLPEFLQDFAGGKARKIYANLEKPDLSLTPPPRFDLIDPRDYASMSLQFSRGCPFNCEFCDIIQMFGRVPRTKTPEQFLGEMELLYATGYRGRLFVVDDNFIGNKIAVKQLLRAMISWQQERHYPFLIFTEASLDLAQDEELLDLMVQAGFTSVFIGIETPDAGTLTAINKLQNSRTDMDGSIEKIQRAGLEVMGGFILGFDSDPPDIFRRQVEFIERNAVVQSMVGLLVVLPNTDLYKRLGEEGRLFELADFSGDNVDIQLNFTPRLPAALLVAGYKRVLLETYAPANYFRRALLLLSRLPDLRTDILRSPVPWKVDLAKARLKHSPPLSQVLPCLLGLLLSPFGRHVFPFLLKSLRYGTLALPIAIDLALRGHHYFTLSKKIDRSISAKSSTL